MGFLNDAIWLIWLWLLRWFEITNSPRNFKENNLAINTTIVNSLRPMVFQWKFTYAIFKPILVIDGDGISYEITIRWMALDHTTDKWTLVQIMAWCRQATGHCLSQNVDTVPCRLMASLDHHELCAENSTGKMVAKIESHVYTWPEA